MMTKKNRWIQRVLGVLVLSLVTHAQAGNFFWWGMSDGVWDSVGNWGSAVSQGTGVPGAGDTATFFFASPNTLLELDGNHEIVALNFQAAPVAYSISAGLVGSTLTLSSGALFATGGFSHSVPNVTLGANGDWTISNPQIEVTGVLTGPLLQKLGTGTLLLTGGTDGSPSTLETLRPRGGEVIVDGGRLNLTSTTFTTNSASLSSNGGDITLRNGADVQLATGGDAGAVIDNGTLTVTDSGTSLTGRRLMVAYGAGNTGSVVVEDSASVDLTSALFVGHSGDGDLTVQNGGSISADFEAFITFLSFFWIFGSSQHAWRNLA